MDEVNKFVYLGATLSKTGGAKKDINRPMNLARGALVKLDPIRSNANITNNTKLKIFNGNVIAVLLYNSETWRMTEADENKLDKFQKKGSSETFLAYEINQ